jgi:hypothetical protein
MILSIYHYKASLFWWKVFSLHLDMKNRLTKLLDILIERSIKRSIFGPYLQAGLPASPIPKYINTVPRPPVSWAHISGRRTPVSTRGSWPLLYNKCVRELRVKPGVWRLEMWALLALRGPRVKDPMYWTPLLVLNAFSWWSNLSMRHLASR